MSHARLFELLYYLLEHGKTSAAVLAERFEVSQRTIYRDVDALSAAGIPIFTEAGRNGGIALMDRFLSFGPLVEVLEPVRIRKAVAELAKKLWSVVKTLTQAVRQFFPQLLRWKEAKQ